ncbi:MAG: putative prepilin peptidase [Pseudonocardiales bacterium]|jgi:leader peptidase (prepilin peptidase)/N-methyltransferase|nr:putative prepilin peptidase [Pseudonocardiales bacterium]
MNSPWPIVALVGLLGLVIGSFLNVVIYRVPRRESLMFPASRCTACQTPIKPWHNMPVLSWLALRGRCSTCQVAISWRYPLVEVATAGLFVATTLRFGLSLQLPAYLYLGAVGITLLMIAVDLRQLPNSIVLPSYVVGALLLMPAGALEGDWSPAIRGLVGMSALWAVYFALAIACPNSVSFSDAALGGLIGLYLGWLSWGALLIGGFGALLIGVAGGATLLARRTERESGVPFGSCLIVASALAIFLAVPVTHWYGSIVTFA